MKNTRGRIVVIAVATILIGTVVIASRAKGVEPGRDRRFIANDNWTVIDTKTHQMWASKDNGKDINWTDAKSYCENYRVGDYRDWRMPTNSELAGLYDKTKAYKSDEPDFKNEIHLTTLIRTTNAFIWASETRGAEASSFYYFQDGGGLWMPKSQADSHRALPVRSAK